MAQTPAPAIAVPAAVTQALAFLNSLVTAGLQFTTGDLTLAAADATSQTPADTAGAACWNAIKSLNFAPIPPGSGIAYLKQRVRDFQAPFVTINNDCAGPAPLFVKAYDQAISEINNLGL